MKITTDYLIIGSGLAGLSFALKVADTGKVTIITKNSLEETNTSYAQGGIAAVLSSPDSFTHHIEDTKIAGAGLCDEKIVEKVISHAPELIQNLKQWGTRFDTEKNGQYDLAKEGGHSANRILHHKDNTGFEIQRALCKEIRNHKNITVLEHFFAVDLITQHHQDELVKRYQHDIRCFGAYALDIRTNIIYTILSKATMLASGGAGQLYSTTTNPTIATGDGFAMVYRAKGLLDNMEFIQFHPTGLYNPKESPTFLISEAVRGFGGKLRNKHGEEFMLNYDERGNLAPRDIVARAIDSEMKKSGDEHVFLDCRHIDAQKLSNHFPTIYKKCQSIGIDITTEMIPVAPAAHYFCGGVSVDEFGRTSINHLYAAGEVSCTGLHGANRLASNSLLEAIAFADFAAHMSEKEKDSNPIQESIPDWDDKGTSHPEEMVLITQSLKEVQQILNNYVGIVRSDVRLDRAFNRLWTIYLETEEMYKNTTLSPKLCELRNLILLGYIVIKSARARKKSIGLHYMVDYTG
ncbi:MAG: L-aspartate oxidase [Bacteroidales bacterium]|jgi:L-aspartate oxidase|nr:L-aspartate oxidase [Bacteroidales bacterium]